MMRQTHYVALAWWPNLYPFFLGDNGAWDDVKAKRTSMVYVDLCRRCFDAANIHCILIDGGLILASTFGDVFSVYRQADSIRLQHKPLNDYILRLALEICKESGKPSTSIMPNAAQR